MAKRVIAHLDCDAFFVSVELRDRPQLRGLPVIVAGSGPRAVVTTASYEARVYGVGSAMSAAEARRRCPQAIVIPPQMARYRETSSRVWAIVGARLPVVQRMGLDEAYADLSGLERPLPLLRGVIADVLAKTGIQISAGIGPNKLVAKIASDLDKPAGFVAIGREDAAARLTSKSVRIIPGIGPKTAARLASIGAPTVGDLQRLPEELLAGHFGRRRGQELHMRALLHDDSPVVTEREAKSRSTETTFDQDVTDGTELERVLLSMAGKLAEGLERSATRAKTVGIKVRLDDWTTVTRVRTLPSPTDHAGLIGTTALQLLSEYGPSRPVRLVGVKVASLCSMSAAKASAGDRAAVPAGQLVLEL